ncbi:TetR/AcrR family transcriptional regulator [Mycobacterium sp. CBMA293]|uniref:TetR/AcrR family transcriptional regulator n=1 Tax=unclassified Mycolicibacterium TaxID=2636767 RepID=UPI0012DE3546|nr:MULTISPECIES: TetR/AcrR family transcriptional regulator [unclassified Mycolicibacterium]MUL45037.1 TetR/AcrR family transcriptional regulator [Mycolicibacterium sp. CBMA 360]MUL57852.1 TetR/AcrR family transcriptional regulator [Mycolicibacterium sp. CBMA 335]MUL72699.1 TetR/AcrR family transcriptional regulator [Mycolicibacterium sp. CBMA 311]MUL95632.1 TetR/AcrR family transcriptional regulator [Mycolicibacterium sp. CBMA 230]MUM07282.1 TetR family transcriptional regulator [Mycolicibact
MVTADPGAERRHTAKGQATRQRILRAAAEVILAEGLSALNMDKVRSAASVSGSQLSYYYDDKQALIRAVLDRQLEVVLDFHRQPQLGGFETFDDYERWIDRNVRYLRRIGYSGTPTYHALAGQLLKSSESTHATLGFGYRRWIELFEQSLQGMKDRGLLVAKARPADLALVLVAAHQGGGAMTFTFRQEWPLTDALRFAVNNLRRFAADPAERVPRRPRRARGHLERRSGVMDSGDEARFTKKGLATRTRIVDKAAQLMFAQGVVGTSLDDVRRAAGVSGSQLAHYFTDKRDLTRQVIASRTGDVLAFHAQPAMAGLDSAQALRAWVSSCVADVEPVYLRGGCVYGSLVGELLESDEELLDDLAAGYSRWLQVFREGFAAMRRTGALLPEADPRHLAAAMVTAHQGGAMLTYAMGSQTAFGVVANASVDYAASFRPLPDPAPAARGSR